MIPAVSSVVLKGKSQEAFKRIGANFQNIALPQLLIAKTKKNYIFVGKYTSDIENIHFQVYNKKCKMTDSFVLQENGNDLNLVKYSALQNRVMRPRDIEISPNKDMSFAQILSARPVIVKRVESLLQAAAEFIRKD